MTAGSKRLAGAELSCDGGWDVVIAEMERRGCISWKQRRQNLLSD